MEGKDVTTCDLPGSFFQTNMEGHILLDGALALLLLKFDYKRWKKYLLYKGKNPVIYAKCDKATYGIITAALLPYKKLVGHLMDWGFKMNLYIPCCWNKSINVEQFTIVFHVDVLKLSHKDRNVMSDIIAKLELIYAAIYSMAMH